MVKGISVKTSRTVMAILAMSLLILLAGNINLAYSQSDNPNIDPRASEVLQNMSYFLGSKQEYTFKAEIMFDQLINQSRKIQYSAEEKVCTTA